ncbi:PQQ-binding-like beta-propeller repeat protein [Streptomyces sp.]|uniref:outer membrane protein assembly factor BamB family protein n=1 Tax=Streptomyces sp. TaxID=1931 RepID=UPI002D403879|nr:PQQ-binding-like beta-propeller repeat protein [Streptomyces sp.]HZF92464.1 PQQ-binding-like beta-propeller repeat protein [Streptomyces sp.]
MSFGPPPSVYTQSSVTADRQRRKRRAVLLAAVAAVVALALSAGAWLWWPGKASDDGKPAAAPAQHRLDVRETVERRPAGSRGAMAVRFSADDMGPGERYEMPGLWATDKILAKGVNKTLIGLRMGSDAAVGDEAWKLPLGGPICGKTRHVTVENRTAVLFRAGEDKDSLCNHVAFVDLDDGKLVWQTEFPVSGNGFGAPDDANSQQTPGVTLTHATVAVTWGRGTDAYDMDGGKRRWRVTSGENCSSSGAGGGRALVVRYSCWREDAPLSEVRTYTVRALDPKSGTTRWTYEPADGVKDVRIVSSDPAVLATAAGDVGITEIISLDERGEYLSTVPLQNGAYVAECTDEVDHLAADECPSVAVGAGQVFLTSKEQGDLVNNANWIIGFDLATGNSVKKFESGPNALLRPLRMSGDQLLALRESSDHISPTALVSLNPRTGAETPYFYFDLPSEGWSLLSMSLADVVVQNGRVFFGAKTAELPPDADGKAWVWLALGIESATTKKP